MSNEQDVETVRHVIKRGFTQVEMRSVGENRIEIVRQKRKHVSGKGYKTVGPERTLFRGTPENACYVAELVREVFESDGE